MMPRDAGGPDAATSFGLIDRMLDEAVALAEAARDYLQGRDGFERAPLAALVQCREIGRVTARVGYVVSWLLACKAERRGELVQSADRAMLLSLGGDALCRDQPELDACPSELRRLLERSEALYRRVERLALMENAASATLH